MNGTPAWDTAWGIVPQDNDYWQIGCNSGGWAGVGVRHRHVVAVDDDDDDRQERKRGDSHNGFIYTVFY